MEKLLGRFTITNKEMERTVNSSQSGKLKSGIASSREE